MKQRIISALHDICNRTESAPEDPAPAQLHGKWLYIFSWITLAPDLSGVSDPVPYLYMFADHICVRTLEANGAIIKKRTVEVYLCNMTHIFSGMGTEDPRLDFLVKIDLCFSRQLHVYAQAEPPPYRIRPVPISLLHKCCSHLHSDDAHQQYVKDLLFMGLFFILRTG